MNYFKEAKTVEDIKYCYRQLAMTYHPDRSDGDVTIMQTVNEQYQQALKSINGQQTTNAEGRQFTYRYDENIESSVMEMLDILLSLKMTEVEIFIIGSWLWVTGSTKNYKEDLKVLGLKWHRKRQCWYWHSPEYRSYQSKDNLDELAIKYGVSVFQSKPSRALTA